MVKFQFHKGTIKADYDYKIWMKRKYFNSIKVQLKRENITPPKYREPLFQFHKGTIKAPTTSK